jgi:polyisoprenyl-phosphate glycosyltransferase
MISIIIPVYNGEKTLKELYRKINTELDGSMNFEVIFVCDYGKDKSWEIIKELARDEDDHIRGYCFDNNYGQHYATSFGLKKACGDYIFTLDEDSQHDPKFIPLMVRKMQDENLDLIYGQFSKIKQSYFRVLMSYFLRRILCLMVPELPRDYSAYRLLSKELNNEIVNKENYSFFLDAELGKLSRNHSSILIEHFKRSKGNSSYTIQKLFNQSIDVLFFYSKLFGNIFNSLMILVFLGFIFSVILLHNGLFQSSVVPIIFLIIFLTFLLIKLNSRRRSKKKQTPKVSEQTKQD